jgi:hypothetical protein
LVCHRCRSANCTADTSFTRSVCSSKMKTDPWSFVVAAVNAFSSGSITCRTRWMSNKSLWAVSSTFQNAVVTRVPTPPNRRWIVLSAGESL